MKNFIKYIYIIGIFWLMSFWSQKVFACDPGYVADARWWCTLDVQQITPKWTTDIKTNLNIDSAKNKVDLQICWSSPDKYWRNSINTCSLKLCIWHSDGYCKDINAGGSEITAKEKECMWWYYDENNSI